MQRSSFTVMLFAALLWSTAGEARDQIRIVGSSTVYPFTAASAEQFGQGGKFKTPIVESTGTGGGFKLFCSGVSLDTPDMTGASRPITEGERKTCAKAGVTDITEIPIGYDGIVLANAKGAPIIALTKEQVFLALARKVPGKDGALIDNPYRSWREIGASLPDQPIEVYGPPPTSGTRDAFVELIMVEACKNRPEFVRAEADEKKRAKSCGLLREDGRYIDAGEDDNVIVQKLVSNHQALGIFGYSFMVENTSKVQALPINGITPSDETIEDGSYKVARSLYVYVKNAHIDQVPGIAEFAHELVGAHAIGPEGYLVLRGLLPLHEADQKTARERVSALKK